MTAASTELIGKEMHLYVVELVGVGVKVGVTTKPDNRIAQHRRDADAYGRSVGRVWVSDPHIEARTNESAIKRMAGRRREYLDISFETAVDHAKTLPTTRADREAVQRKQEQAMAFFESLLATPVLKGKGL